MAVDCAKDLKKHNVAFVSLWPGPTKTEQVSTVGSTLKNEEFLQIYVRFAICGVWNIIIAFMIELYL